MRVKIALLLLLTSVGISTYAQSTQPIQKIGHADWEYIFSQMPAYKSIETELRVFEVQLQNQLASKNQELETKYKIHQNLPVNTPEAIKKDKEYELAYLQENIQRFQQEAQNAMQQKKTILLSPVVSKVAKAIEDVAKENGYSYIINPEMVSGGDVLLYTDEKYNISELVLKKLGVTKSSIPSKPE